MHYLRSTSALAAALASLLGAVAHAQQLPSPETMVEQIVVTSALHRSRAETVLPVNVLAGDELREKAAATLGEMLNTQVGISNASFGTGVGLPVIRGQSANRVQILQMGVGNLDASAVSPDHANSIEPSLAERIEVIRGPATLLYGNGAIGGVVNVIDGRIPRSEADGLQGMAEARYDSVSDQRVGLVRLDGGSGQFAWHVDAVDRESNDTEIAGFALDPALVDLADPLAHAELLASRGRLANSSVQSDARALGASWILDDGWIGLAYNRLDNEYGLPRGPHALHAHDEDDQVDERAAESEYEDADVRIIMEQERYDLEGLVSVGGDLFGEFHGKLSHVDYRHVEVESGGNFGTVFDNSGIEGRFTMHVNAAEAMEGVLGLQFSRREFAAQGQEAFIPRTDIGSMALFAVQSLTLDSMTYELGLRAERQRHNQSGSCDADSTNYSGSGSAIWRVSESSNLLFSVNHSQRSATVEELFSNITIDCEVASSGLLVPHAATQRLEIGLPAAKREQSTNYELGWRKYAGAITAELNLFYNDIADYLYLFDTGEYLEDIQIARYSQEDAVFKGAELQVSLPLYEVAGHKSDLTLFGDYVDARFDSAGNLPRIPPARYGLEWVHTHLDWMLKLRWVHVAAQTDHAPQETRTKGYQLLTLYGDYQLALGQSANLLLFARGNNLLDEEIRLHTSLLKDVAPAAGRGVEVGIRLDF